jgi:hypothetical protein
MSIIYMIFIEENEISNLYIYIYIYIYSSQRKLLNCMTTPSFDIKWLKMESRTQTERNRDDVYYYKYEYIVPVKSVHIRPACVWGARKDYSNLHVSRVSTKFKSAILFLVIFSYSLNESLITLHPTNKRLVEKTAAEFHPHSLRFV